MKGIAVRDTFPDWLRARVMISKSEEAFWYDVAACVNTYKADRLREDRIRNDSRREENRRAADRNPSAPPRSDKVCQFCGYNGHEFSKCRRMKATQQLLPPRRNQTPRPADGTLAAPPTAHPTPQNPAPQNPATPQSATQDPARSNIICYNCHHPGHISTNCLDPRRVPARTTAAAVNYTGTDDPLPLYLSIATDSSSGPAYFRPVLAGASAVERITNHERIDKHDIIDVQQHTIDLPLSHVLTQTKERREVFAFSPPNNMTTSPSSVLQSFTHTTGGQKMLTNWDTAALLSLVPLSTVRALNLNFTPWSDVSFVVANGSQMAPIGYCANLQFSFPDSPLMFGEKVYVVDKAPFQLLLGIRFLHHHWAGLFLPWAKIVLLRPHRIELQGSLDKPPSCSDLIIDEPDDLRLAVTEEQEPTSLDDQEGESVEMLITVPMHLEIGKRNLVSELDRPTSNDFQASAFVTRQFVRDTFHLGPTCPQSVIEAAIDLIISH